ncbi:MAG: HEPN domain-containing protein [Microcoleaceae cyanobacterium]
MENIEYSGYWWLPSEPEQTIAGTLTFTNAEGIKLQLIGSFIMLKKTLDVPIILGIANQNIITLCSCYSSISIPGFSSEEYWAELALIGKHFTKPDELLFHKATVQYSYLSDWVDLPHIKREPDFIDWNKDRELRFTYTRPEDIEANTTYGKFSVIYGYSVAGKFESIDFKQFASLIIQPNEELSFKYFYSKFIHPLNNFISFATDRTNSITKLEFYSRYGDVINSSYSLDEIPITAICRTYCFDRKEKNRLLFHNENFFEMLFSLADIKSDFSLIMQRWFNSFEELDSVFNLFFSIRYKPDMYLEDKFIYLVQAAESYHRRRIKNQVLPDNEHEKRKKAVLDSVPDEYKKWLEEKLQFSNEPGLKERLIDLCELIPEVTNQLIHNKESFATKIKNARNYLTHYNKSLKKKLAKPEELSWFIESLSFILQACFLKELGCTTERCHQLLNRNNTYKKAVARARYQKNNKAEN